MGSHVTPLQRSFRSHPRSLTPNGQDMYNWSLYPHSITLMDFHGNFLPGYVDAHFFQCSF